MLMCTRGVRGIRWERNHIIAAIRLELTQESTGNWISSRKAMHQIGFIMDLRKNDELFSEIEVLINHFKD